MPIRLPAHQGIRKGYSMVILTQSLEHWLWINHPELIVLLGFGHVELFTPEMQQEYIAWCKTDEGRQYLNGGSRYKPDPELEQAIEEAMNGKESERMET